MKPRGTGRGERPARSPAGRGGTGTPCHAPCPTATSHHQPGDTRMGPPAWQHLPAQLTGVADAPGRTRYPHKHDGAPAPKPMGTPLRTILSPETAWGAQGHNPNSQRDVGRDPRDPHTNPRIPAWGTGCPAPAPSPHLHAGTPGPPQPPSRPPTSKDPIYPLQRLLSAAANSRPAQAAPPGPRDSDRKPPP